LEIPREINEERRQRKKTDHGMPIKFATSTIITTGHEARRYEEAISDNAPVSEVYSGVGERKLISPQ